jgi:sugar phosphate isomerase/epimerase
MVFLDTSAGVVRLAGTSSPAGKVRWIGACVRAADLEAAAAAELPFVELVASEVLDSDLLERIGRLGVRLQSVRKLFPSTINIQHVGLQRACEHLSRVAEASARLGSHTLVLGSGAARRWEAPGSRAAHEFGEALALLRDTANAHGARLLLEVLPGHETNVATTLAEASHLRHACDGYVLDFGHVGRDSSLEHFLNETGPSCIHLHASGNAHRVPDDSEISEVVAWLRLILDKAPLATVSVELHQHATVGEAERLAAALERLYERAVPNKWLQLAGPVGLAVPRGPW